VPDFYQGTELWDLSLVDPDNRRPVDFVTADLQAPLGEAWKTSRVLLPAELAGRSFRHELTGAELRPTVAGDQSWLFLGQIFEHVPVGILRAA
jgi:maltooligosyltrehalose synthase